MAKTTLSATVADENAGRVDAVVRQLASTSHSQTRGLFDHDCVSVNGRSCSDTGAPVATGDVVAICFDPNQRYREKKKKRWDDRTFTVTFEDEHLIVVDKSAGTLTVPTDREEINTLVERVSVYLSHSRGKRQACVVHRLDRDVSGLVVFGKHEKVAARLIEQFKQQKQQRVYTAIVAGVMEHDEGTLRSHLATGNNLERYVTGKSDETDLAVTNYRVIRRLTDATLVEVTLEALARGQIRVQFAHADHPVLGDRRYRPELAMHPKWIRKRLALHAKSLSFEHPVTGKVVHFDSPLPAAIQKFVAGNR